MKQCPISLIDHDNYSEQAPFERFAELRRDQPIFWHEDAELNEGFWCLTRQKEIDFVSKNADKFSVRTKGIRYIDESPEMAEQRKLIMTFMEPPYHRTYRRVIDKSFKPKVIEGLLDNISDMAKGIVDQVAGKGQCEFVSEVSRPLPLKVICQLLGVHAEDELNIAHWSDIIMAPDDPELALSLDDYLAAGQSLTDYAKKMYREQQHNSRDNLSRLIMDSKIEGKAMTEEEFCAFFRVLIVAGNETVRNTTTSGMRLLIEHPKQLQYLIDNPEKISDAVEEILRFRLPVLYFRRTSKVDIVLGGKQIKKGDKIMMWYVSANQDETHFKDGHLFDVTRPQREAVRQQHRSFGVGDHFCLGSHLARLELNVMFKELIPRLQNPKIVSEPRKMRSYLIDAIKEMHITFDPEIAKIKTS